MAPERRSRKKRRQSVDLPEEGSCARRLHGSCATICLVCKDMEDSPSALEWIRQQEHHEDANEPLNELMALVGLEEVKTHCLKVFNRVHRARSQGFPLSPTEFDVNFVGNRGTGKSMVGKLYKRLLETLDVDGHVHDDDSGCQDCLEIELPDYTNDELLKIIAQWMDRKVYGDRLKVEGGTDGIFLHIFIRRLRRPLTQGTFNNISTLQKSFIDLQYRQIDRVKRERRAGRKTDDSLVTKEDLIGIEPLKKDQISAWKDLEAMIGLEDVKATIETMINQVSRNYYLELEDKDPVPIALYQIFVGPPGTGKKSVGRLYGRILAELGLLPNAKTSVTTLSELRDKCRRKSRLPNFLGQAVLIVNEIHLLNRHEEPAYANLMKALLTMAQSSSTAKCIILTGLKEEMEAAFENPESGIAQAFSSEQAFHFCSFSESEFDKVLSAKLAEQKLQMSSEARNTALEVLSRTRLRPGLANGHAVEDLLNRAEQSHQRTTSTTSSVADDQRILEVADIDSNRSDAVPFKTLFKNFIGNENVVLRFEEYQKIATGMRRRGIDPRLHLPFTYIFRGPPGTGKTVTARRLGRVFYDMGFISNAEVIECSVTNLIGEYVGQTGPKVLALLEKALGKVLFIDEAYRLQQGSGNYTDEAIGELVDALTKERFQRKLVVILAGYEEDMKKLMRVNRGLRSRFSTDIDFKPMEPKDCLRLLNQSLGEVAIQIEGAGDVDGSQALDYVQALTKLKKLESWANARSVEKLTSDIAGHVFRDPARVKADATDLIVSRSEALSLMKESNDVRDHGSGTNPEKFRDLWQKKGH